MADKTVIVIDVQGEVTYTTPENRTSKPLTPGAVIPPDSTVKLGKDASVSLYENHPIFITKKGKRAIKKLIDKNKIPVRGTFEFFFKDQLTYALGDLKDEPAANEDYGFTKTSSDDDEEDTTDGWGENALRVINVMKCKEKVVPCSLKFEWGGLKGASTYELTVAGADDDTVVLNACVTGTTLKTDLKDLALETDKEYWWQVKPKDGNASGKSEKSFFIITKPDADSKSVEKLKSVKCFSDAGPVLKAFMKAVRLERDELLSEAYKIYEGLYNSSPGNDVVKRMFMAFLWRNNMKSLARELMGMNTAVHSN